jgi:hypothetical protein
VKRPARPKLGPGGQDPAPMLDHLGHFYLKDNVIMSDVCLRTARYVKELEAYADYLERQRAGILRKPTGDYE